MKTVSVKIEFDVSDSVSADDVKAYLFDSLAGMYISHKLPHAVGEDIELSIQENGLEVLDIKLKDCDNE